MFKKIIILGLGVAGLTLAISGCKTPALVTRTERNTLPASFNNSQDSTSSATIRWKEFFTDPHLITLIDSALQNNQELNITMQEIEMSRNEIMARQGE